MGTDTKMLLKSLPKYVKNFFFQKYVKAYSVLPDTGTGYEKRPDCPAGYPVHPYF
jgi:hypothetical protein